MHITWLGMSCFKIQTKESVTILDPYQDKHGLKMPKAKADIVLSTDPKNELCNNFSRIMGKYFIADRPGEYETKNNFIYGLTAGHGDQKHSTIYLIEIEGINIAHLGLINHSLIDAQLETMEGADILFLPVSSLTPDRRQKVISQIEPRIIIPMYYKIPKYKAKLESLDKFNKEMGGRKTEPQEKFIIKKKDLPQDETKVIILKPNA